MESDNKNYDEWTLESYPACFVQEVSEASYVCPFENGWGVYCFDEGRIEEFDILEDGSVEVWRSRSSPGAEGTHSSLERQYFWLDTPVNSIELQGLLANWSKEPTLESLEAIVNGLIDCAEERQTTILDSETESEINGQHETDN